MQGTPASLLHPSFGRFVDAKRTYEPSAKFARAALALCDVLSRYYANEQRKMAAVRKFFAKWLDLPYQTVCLVSSSSDTDGSIVDDTSDVQVSTPLAPMQCTTQHCAAKLSNSSLHVMRQHSVCLSAHACYFHLKQWLLAYSAVDFTSL